MKNLLIIVLALGMFACGSSKESATEQIKNPVKPVATESVITGVVKDMRKHDGCDFVIAVVMADNRKETLLEPLELDEEFKVHGKAVKLSYTVSKRRSKCLGTMPIVIHKIK